MIDNSDLRRGIKTTNSIWRNELIFQKEELLQSGFKSNSKIDVGRFKGLGEMNPEQLWETTLDPNNRTLMKVRIDDEIESKQVFEDLMGDDVAPRRKFIEDGAASVVNLDI